MLYVSANVRDRKLGIDAILREEILTQRHRDTEKNDEELLRASVPLCQGNLPHGHGDAGLAHRIADLNLYVQFASGSVRRNAGVDLEETRDLSWSGAGVEHLGRAAEVL